MIVLGLEEIVSGELERLDVYNTILVVSLSSILLRGGRIGDGITGAMRGVAAITLKSTAAPALDDDIGSSSGKRENGGERTVIQEQHSPPRDQSG